jgi:hypothetical protein
VTTSAVRGVGIWKLFGVVITKLMVYFGVDGRIILRGIFRKWEGAVGTAWSGLRIGTGGRHL